MNNDAPELYLRYRPTSFKEVVGQPEAVRMLMEMGKKGTLPHALLFTGPSGTGKTTLARILKKKLKCSDHDFEEINAADHNGIDDIRRIGTRMTLSPMSGDCRVWLMDECHSLTKNAQQGFLKLLEDTPKNVYFFLCTTDPAKLLPTVKSRLTEIPLKPLSPGQCAKLLTSVAKQEGKELEKEVVDRIVEVADGGARRALVILHQIIDIADTEERLAAIDQGDHRAAAIEIARQLMNPRGDWKAMAKVLKGQSDEEVEGMRRLVLGYAKSILLGGGKLTSRAYSVIVAFQEPFYDSGLAGFSAACYFVLHGE